MKKMKNYVIEWKNKIKELSKENKLRNDNNKKNYHRWKMKIIQLMKIAYLSIQIQKEPQQNLILKLTKR